MWDACLPEELKRDLKQKDCYNITNINDLIQFGGTLHNSGIEELFKEIESLSLHSFSNIVSRKEHLQQIHFQKSNFIDHLHCELMKAKKWHEVETFTQTVTWLDKEQSNIIIDAGAGKGYASLHLANHFDRTVLAIECSQTNHDGAISHQKLTSKKKKIPLSNKIHYVIAEITESTDYEQIVNRSFPNFSENLIMTALHACGTLTDSVVTAFLKLSCAKSLCIVPCCYHLSVKSLSSIYEFSKNARMLAQQSTVKMKETQDHLSPSLFYRAILQVFLKTAGYKNVRLGRNAPTTNFLTYAKWSLQKIKFPHVVTDSTLEELYETFSEEEWKFRLFQLLRINIAPVIEASIILDKLLFIKNSKVCKELQLVQMFDSALSPRSWAIIAKK
uniref:Methyltransferase domain-containing protein n=1 Tax=Trichogramma kaykai TaxID=54128 RepID=A0ABD2XDZ2_9HYME